MGAGRAGRIIVALLASLSLASCADSGGGIGGTGYVSNGTITAVGSIVVNDVEFDTTHAEVIIGGTPKGVGNQAVMANLDVGQAVVVEGTENDDGASGTAARIRFTPLVKGPVTEISDLGNGVKRIVVLDKTIFADGRTFLKNATLGDLTVGNLIEVSGLLGGLGVIRATHLRKTADSFGPAFEVEVKGFIQDLDSGAQTFKFNGLVVYYGSVEIGSLPAGTPNLGQWVNVKARAAGSFLAATKIEAADEVRIANADRFVLEGLITGFTSTSDFMVGIVQVHAGGDTIFVGGPRERLAPGTEVRVRGRLVDSILQAQQILFRQ